MKFRLIASAVVLALALLGFFVYENSSSSPSQPAASQDSGARIN